MDHLVDQMLGAGFQWEHLLPLSAILFAILLLMSSMRRRSRGRPEPRQGPTARGRLEPGSEQANLCRDLESLMVELQELSRKISAQIDTRFAKLEATIRDADRRIAVLTRLNQSPADPVISSSEKFKESAPGHSAVYEMADAGFSAVDIARELGRTTGEVELILNLRPKSA